jgi:MFS superfamily sulfate permease-like transporter
MVLLRLHGAMYYANALTVRDQVRSRVQAGDPPPTAVVLDLGAQDALDLTSAKTLSAMAKELRGQGVGLYLTDLHAPALAFAQSAGVLDAIGAGHVFPSIDLAVRHLAQEDSR